MFPQYVFYSACQWAFLCIPVRNLFSEEVVSDNNPVFVLYVYVHAIEPHHPSSSPLPPTSPDQATGEETLKTEHTLLWD